MGLLERGKNTPNIEMIFKLLPTLKVSFAEYAALFESTLRLMRRKSIIGSFEARTAWEAAGSPADPAAPPSAIPSNEGTQ